MRRAGGKARRILLGAEEEGRAGQNTGEPGADAGVEIAAILRAS